MTGRYDCCCLRAEDISYHRLMGVMNRQKWLQFKQGGYGSIDKVGVGQHHITKIIQKWQNAFLFVSVSPAMSIYCLHQKIWGCKISWPYQWKRPLLMSRTFPKTREYVKNKTKHPFQLNKKTVALTAVSRKKPDAAMTKILTCLNLIITWTCRFDMKKKGIWNDVGGEREEKERRSKYT